LWSTYLLVLALQVGTVAAAPTWQALVPELVGADELGPVVGASQALTTTASVAAPAVAGLTAGTLGFGAPLWIDAATFVVLAVAAAAIRTVRAAPPRNVEGAGSESRPYSLRSDRLLWPLLVGLCFLVLVGEVANVVEVFLLRGELGASSFAFGVVAAVLAAAVVFGSIAAGRTATDAFRARRAPVAALVLGLALALGGLAPTLGLFACAWAVVGVANGIVNVDASTIVLTRAPDFCRGRVLARVNAMVRGSTIGALAIGGAAGSLLGARETFVVSGLLMAVVAVGLFLRIRQASAGPALSAS
jgi:MFS family permease